MTQPAPQPTDPRQRPLVLAFPQPGMRVENAYRELGIALYGTEKEKRLLGNPRHLPRPWDPPSCRDPLLRAELWEWLDQVVTWLNHEYVWDTTALIPACWPRHPHLVHEIAVLTDQRRNAGHALTSDPLEDWHRYALPTFTERMRQRLATHCDDRDHQPWPAHSRHTRHTAEQAAGARTRVFAADTAERGNAVPQRHVPGQLQLIDGLHVDPETGEVDPGQR